MQQTRITFIGGGNMAEALIRGLLRSGHQPAALRACDPDNDRRQLLEGLGILTSAHNNLDKTDVLVLALKPQILGDVLKTLALKGKELVISIAAGVPLDSLSQWCPKDQPIVRCMPNTPALIGEGMTALFPGPQVSAAQKVLAQTVLQAAGKTLWVDQEDHLDAVTAVSGSGPAYFFYLMESMINAGEALGLDRSTATQLTLQTAVGASLMARDSDVDPATLRMNVTSPGGTTQRALSILDRRQVQDAFIEALSQAATRSKELAKEFGSE